MKIELSDAASETSYTSENSQNSSDVGTRNIILVSLDGMQSGVPTLTTSTLTPTTLRNIEQTFIELTSDPPVSAPYQAGFVPPLAPLNFTDSNDNNSMGSTESGSQSSWHTPIIHEENSLATTDTSSVATLINPNGSPSLPVATSTALVANEQRNHQSQLSTIAARNNSTTPAPSRRNLGGRRPMKPSNLTPEEEEKRRQRRERNKLAAARCRKRRVDQTNELIEKVNQLEKDKEGLQKQIEELTALKEDIQLCLDAHRSHCTLNLTNGIIDTEVIDRKPTLLLDEFDTKCIKTEPLDSLDGPPLPKRIMLSSSNPVVPPPLPNVSAIASCLLSSSSIKTISTSIAGMDMGVIPSSNSSIPSNVDVNNATITNSTATSSIISNPVSLIPLTSKPNRPSTLNVPLTITPSQSLLNKSNNNYNGGASDIAGVPITTPSSGVMFNFDSLMDGGTGLTPVTAPLMPTCSSQNKHPLELTTPTSEPSKLVSL